MSATVSVGPAHGIVPGQRITIDGRSFVVESAHRGAVVVGRPRLRDWIAIGWMRLVDLVRNVGQWGAP